MKRRTFLEILTVMFLVLMATYSLTTPSKKNAHYTLDNNKISYDGSMLKGKFNGYGKLSLANHDRYVGYFKNGQFSGKGTFTSHQNWQYKGNFNAGVPDGSGTLTTANHKKYSGTFSKGELRHAN
ncbi:hypothetical protein [Pediococcus stilesii]|uniref:MORN repeat protein n=1 Tax=Pediococcus stilesii TaxID=331679 RepID=A0A0R2KZ31_9LACO|nr:hypothetical protein [Pediococcus stilesii]KRN94811.1 hypothetical protein IV81_GL001088 [Pediococcus stilesii]